MLFSSCGDLEEFGGCSQDCETSNSFIIVLNFITKSEVRSPYQHEIALAGGTQPRKILKQSKKWLRNGWIYFEICNAFNTTRTVNGNSEERKWAHPKHLIETTWDSDDKGPRVDKELFLRSTGNEEERGNFSKSQHPSDLRKQWQKRWRLQTLLRPRPRLWS